MNDIISPNQTAIVPGRNMAENVNKAKTGVPSRWKLGKLMIQWKIWNGSSLFSAFKLWIYYHSYILCESKWRTSGLFSRSQGDETEGSLSPYLFLLAMEFLTQVLKKGFLVARNSNSIPDVRICSLLIFILKTIEWFSRELIYSQFSEWKAFWRL